MIYVASSWRNPVQIGVIHALRAAGLEAYDFRKPKTHNDGFHWSEVMPSVAYGGSGELRHVQAQSASAEDFLVALEHERCIEGFGLDFGAMQECDTCVLVLPCGRSAHLELGWFVGQGRKTAILLDDPVTPELMYRMVDYVAPSLFDLLGWLGVED